MKLPAVELRGIFSVEYDFILSSLANPAAKLRQRSLSTFKKMNISDKNIALQSLYKMRERAKSQKGKLCFFLLITCCVFIVACDSAIDNKSSPKKIFLTISVEKFKRKLDTNKFILIDVKTNKEHEKEYIPGSRVIDFYGKDYKNKIDSLDKQKKYLIYCHKGARSSLTLRLMKVLGFKEVYELKEGISSWKTAGYKVIKQSR